MRLAKRAAFVQKSMTLYLFVSAECLRHVSSIINNLHLWTVKITAELRRAEAGDFSCLLTSIQTAVFNTVVR